VDATQQQLPPLEPKTGTDRYVGKFMLGLNWDVAIPVGSVENFTSNASAVGFELLFQYWLRKNLTIGGSLDWQTYWDEKPRTTYPIENGAVTATADNSVQNGAARAIIRAYPLDRGPLLPYVGFNIGVGWSTFQSAAADLLLYDNTVSVLIGGEIGVAIAASRDIPLFTVGARYTTLPAANFINVDSVQSVTFQFGVMSQ
jgi:hypothetical protein